MVGDADALIKENRLVQVEDTAFEIPTIAIIGTTDECVNAINDIVDVSMQIDLDDNSAGEMFSSFRLTSSGVLRKFNVIFINNKFSKYKTQDFKILKTLSTLMHECIHVVISNMHSVGVKTHIDDNDDDYGEIICNMSQTLFYRIASRMFPDLNKDGLEGFPIFNYKK